MKRGANRELHYLEWPPAIGLGPRVWRSQRCGLITCLIGGQGLDAKNRESHVFPYCRSSPCLFEAFREVRQIRSTLCDTDAHASRSVLYPIEKSEGDRRSRVTLNAVFF